MAHDCHNDGCQKAVDATNNTDLVQPVRSGEFYDVFEGVEPYVDFD